jgi:hypothetical protein
VLLPPVLLVIRKMLGLVQRRLQARCRYRALPSRAHLAYQVFQKQPQPAAPA